MNELEYELQADSSGNKFQMFWREKRFESIVTELEEICKGSEKILDVGCGPGINVKKLVNLGFDVSGLDVNDKFLKYARENFGRKFYKGNLEKKITTKKFDVVICSEVIEHIKNEKVFANLNKCLKSGGWLILTTPNYGGIWNFVEKIWGMKAKHVWSDTHYTRYDKNKLEKKLSDSGFETVSMYSILFASPFFPFLSKRLAEKIYFKEMRLNKGALLVSVSRKIV